MGLIRLDEPRPRLPMSKPGWAAFMAMGFRPFYLLAAAFGAAAILAWVAGFNGTGGLPGMFWHGHEMIWGYAGAVIVGFLLTAVCSWTGQPPFSGTPLAVLAGLWLAARVAAATEPGATEPGAPLITGLLSVGFFLMAAVAVARPIIRARSKRNYGVPLLMLAFATANALYLLSVSGVLPMDPRRLLFTGLLLVAGFITLVGLRVIPFFTHRALQRPQVGHPKWAGLVALLSPVVLAVLIAADAPSEFALLVGAAGMSFNLVLLVRNAHGSMRTHPLLWILYAGYTLTALGIGLVGLALALMPELLSAAVHCIAIGGVGVLTLGMMTRTALGHTGRPLTLPSPMVIAYSLMLLATALRLAAAFASAAYTPLIHAAGASFAAALLLFAWRYGPWLISTRKDGMPG